MIGRNHGPFPELLNHAAAGEPLHCTAAAAAVYCTAAVYRTVTAVLCTDTLFSLASKQHKQDFFSENTLVLYNHSRPPG